MYDISKANRNVEMFVFDIFIAIQKIKLENIPNKLGIIIPVKIKRIGHVCSRI